MPTTFEKVAKIIADTSEIDINTITPESHTIDDLGIDSLDFLDIVFAIDKEFGIKIPLEQWTQEVNEGKVSTEEYFVLKNLCAKIDELRAAKGCSGFRPSLAAPIPMPPVAPRARQAALALLLEPETNGPKTNRVSRNAP